MRSNTRIFRLVQFVCLLTIASVHANDDFKKEFGERFGIELKRLNANLLQSNMDSLKNFYEEAIGVLSLRPLDERSFRQRIESIDAIKARIGDSVTEETVKSATSFTKLVIFELLMFRSSKTVRADPARSEQFDDAMKKSAEREIGNVSQFIKDLHAKWSDFYPTIPKTELEKHPQYEEINESIENLAKMDDSFDNVLPRTIAVAETLRKLSTFFNYTEWNIILQKKL